MTTQNTDDNKKRATFHKLAFITLIAVYFLILVGGIVRSTGSGMGCPDWPKCFGQWVPPTNESQLPENYKEKYTQKRVDKNSRLANYLEAFGMEEKARQVLEDDMVMAEQDFNIYKTWTEYVNRLVGVTIGLFVMATFFASIKYFTTRPVLFWMSLGVLLLTGFQGWLGSLVVSTNLLPWMVTVHMLVSFVIVAGIIYLLYLTRNELKNPYSYSPFTIILLILCMITLIVQVVYGTQVREGIDVIALSLQNSYRDTWIGLLDWSFYFHRSFSWVVLILHLWLLLNLRRVGEKFWSTSLLGVILISIASGVIMVYFAIPPVLQPIHLLFGCIAFGIQFYLLLIGKKKLRTEVVRV